MLKAAGNPKCGAAFRGVDGATAGGLPKLREQRFQALEASALSVLPAADAESGPKRSRTYCDVRSGVSAVALMEMPP